MPKFFAFLRAINVGGHNVKMEFLRGQFESLGFTNVETFIASGNVIFESKVRNSKTLEKKIADQLYKCLGYEVATFIRSDKELVEIARYMPFTAPAVASAAALNIAFLSEPLGKEQTMALMKLKTEVDDFHVHEREVYWLSRTRQGESTFSNSVFERILKGKATFRNVNTIVRLAAKHLGLSVPGAVATGSR